tara:strand:+ start:396 stop:2645 length:2250 start_codon:yes stop_codon:yes gene_type:complete
MVQQIPVAILKQAASNPKILGPLLISTVGAQNADKIINALSNNQIPFDDVLNILVGSPISSVVNQMGSVDTPDGVYLGPTQEDLDRARKESEILNKPTSTPIPEEKKVTVDDIGFTQVDQTPQIISSPIPPEEKVSVDDIGMTAAPAPRLQDMIMTILEPPENPSDEEKEIQERLNNKMFKDQSILDFVKGNPNVDYKQEAIDRGGYIGDTVGGKFWAKYPANPFPGGETTYKNRVLTYMKPEDFLKLAEKKDFNTVESKTAFKLYENTNTGLSVPFLNGNLNEKGQIEIDGHEGRHRAEYVRRLDPDTPIPVYITVSAPSGQEQFVNQQTYNYGRSLTEAGDILLNADFINEEGNPVDVKILGYDIEGKKAGEFFDKADQIFSGPEFVSNATKLKDKNVKIPDILEFLDKGKKRDIFNEADYKAMLDEGLQEINYQLQQEVTGEGWYDEGVRKAMEIAPKINPKFADNPDLKDLLIFTTAISSSGVNVGADFKVGLQVVDIFADTGQIPLRNPNTNLGWTQRGTNLAKQLNLANNYIQKNGLPAFLEFLHSEMTGRELNNFRKEYGNLGPASGGVRMDEIYSGHRAFGPKIGEFMANLYGTDDNNVTDMWNIRGMNRLMGGSMYMRDAEGNIMKDKDGKILENTGTPTKEYKNIFDKYMTDLSNLIGKTVRDTQAIRWYLEQGLYTALGVRSVPKDYATAAQEVLDQKLKTESDGTIRSSKTSNTKNTSPTKKAKGGYVIPLPEIDML